jgi:peptidoglycan/LPS O-acetylase OafA/YrhL
MNNYKKFGLMMAVSFIIMYAVMFLNADLFSHVMLSYTRTYMTILMIAPMAVSMMLFMWGMYGNKKLNAIILSSAVVFLFVTLFMLRNQTLIKDVQYMKAMIPHHSSAIMVSQSATFEDPETAKLAKEIIEAQKREIEQMKNIIRRLEGK